MPDCSNLIVQVRNCRRLFDLADIFDEFEIELVEVCLNIDTLQLWVVKLVHQTEIRVDLKCSILAHNHAHLIARAGCLVNLGHGTVLEQW